MPSAAQTRATSSTVSRKRRSSSRTPPRPREPGRNGTREPGRAAVTQPPFRPEAPNPANASSSTMIRSPGSARLR